MKQNQRTSFGARFAGRSVLVAMVLGLLAAVGGVAVASGALSKGSSVELGRLATGEELIATGDADVAGPWRLTTYQSSESEAQPGGLPCLRLVLADPPADTPFGGAGFCGEPSTQDGYMATAVSVKNFALGRSALMIFGRAPDGIARVALRGGGNTFTAPVQRAVPSLGGNVWVIAVPSTVSDGDLQLLRADGSKGGPVHDGSGFFESYGSVKKLEMTD